MNRTKTPPLILIASSEEEKCAELPGILKLSALRKVIILNIVPGEIHAHKPIIIIFGSLMYEYAHKSYASNWNWFSVVFAEFIASES